MVSILCNEEIFVWGVLFKIVGGVKRRVGVVAGETLTITGNDELEENMFEETKKKSQ